MSQKIVLKLTGIGKLGEGRAILRGVDWTVRQGQHWALLGANGAGKTTLLRIVAGYDWPSDGSIQVLGAQFGRVELAELRKKIGWVSCTLLDQFHEDDPAVAIVASGLEASIGLWRDFSTKEFSRARRALESIGAGQVADQPYPTLSQGERQRVMIARALINQPRLLILDEPCAGLDPAARETFLHELTRFARRAAAPSLVFVTHHIEEIPPFVTHAMVLMKGRILAEGPVAKVCTSKIMSKALDSSCKVTQENGRYHLQIGRR